MKSWKNVLYKLKLFVEENVWKKIAANPNQKCHKSLGYQHTKAGSKSCSGVSEIFSVWGRRTSKGAEKEKSFTTCSPAQRCLILQYGEFSTEFGKAFWWQYGSPNLRSAHRACRPVQGGPTQSWLHAASLPPPNSSHISRMAATQGLYVAFPLAYPACRVLHGSVVAVPKPRERSQAGHKHHTKTVVAASLQYTWRSTSC